MKESRVAKRYARALFSAAHRLNIISSIEEDLNAISTSLGTSDKFRQFLIAPTLPHSIKYQFLYKVFSDKVNALTMQLLKLLLEKQREGEFEAIRNEFLELYRQYQQVLYVEVTSAREMDEKQKKELIDNLSRTMGKLIEAKFKIDSTLISGVKVTYGNSVYDGSVQGALRRLRDTWVHGSLKQA